MREKVARSKEMKLGVHGRSLKESACEVATEEFESDVKASSCICTCTERTNISVGERGEG